MDLQVQYEPWLQQQQVPLESEEKGRKRMQGLKAMHLECPVRFFFCYINVCLQIIRLRLLPSPP